MQFVRRRAISYGISLKLLHFSINYRGDEEDASSVVAMNPFDDLGKNCENSNIRFEIK